MSNRLACAAAVALALVLLVHAHRNWRLCYTGGGDSPYYMMMAKSLVHDGDLRLTPEETAYSGYYREFPVNIDPRIFSKERPYCWHPIGAPLLFAPAYALGGRYAVLFEIALMACLAAGALWLYLREATGDGMAAGVVVALTVLTVPFLPLAVNEYTEMPALMLQAAGLALLARLDPGRAAPARLLAIGAIAGYLPWLHARYAGVAGALAAWAIARSGPTLRRAAWVVTPAALSVIALYAWGVHVTGAFSLALPATLSGGNQPAQLSLATLVRRGLPGHLTDQQGGLLVYAPWWALAALGAGAAWRAWRREVLVHLTYAVPTFALVASYYNWSGHWGVPCRFLAALVPLLALALVPVARAAMHRGGAALAAIAPGVLWSLMVSGMMLVWPPLALSLESPQVNLGAPFVFLKQHAGISLLTAFPRFVYEPGWRDYLIAASLSCVVVAWLRVVRRALARAPWRRAVALLVAALAAHSYADGVTRPPGDPLDEDERWSQLDHVFLMSYPAHYETAAFQALKKGRSDMARVCIERVIEVRPDWPPAYAQMAVILKRRDPLGAKRYARMGLEALEEGMAEHPDRVFWAGYLRLLKDDFAGARENFIEYLKRPGRQAEEARKILAELEGAPRTGR